MSMSLRLLRNSPELTPTISTLKSAAADLRADIPKPKTLAKGTGFKFPTGVSARFSQGHCGLLLPRSGLASAPSYVTIPNAPALIDEDYTGEIFVLLFVLGSAGITINPGDRIAQIICVERAKITGHVDFSSTIRGDSGFGSTGVE